MSKEKFSSIEVTLKRSTLGSTQKQRDAVRCLGLKKIRSKSVVGNNPAMRGQIFKIQHLLTVNMIK